MSLRNQQGAPAWAADGRRNRAVSYSSTPGDLEKCPTHGDSVHRLGFEGKDRHIPFSERLQHMTFAWFTLTMSTGGIAALLAAQPHTFSGICTIGKIVYIFDLFLFVILCLGMTIRFARDPSALSTALLRHPSEALLFPTFWLSWPTIIGGMAKYGNGSVGSWLPIVERVLFWIYLACTFVVAVAQYFHLFRAHFFTATSMTPSWILPVFPVMLCGTLAGLIAADQDPEQRLPILIAGVTFQGLGIMVAMLMSASWIMRLMTNGLPAPDLRPGMFIAVGPPSFTGLALISMSQALPEGYGYFARYPQAAMVLQVLSTFTAIFLWALAFWFFSISLVAVLASARMMHFHLVWYAFVFPNTGFTITTISIGTQLESEGIMWIGSIMSILIVATWLFVMGVHAWALWTRRMMMPGLDEDKEEEEKR